MEHFENPLSTEQHKFESQSKNVKIEFDNKRKTQKFVELVGASNNETYIASYPDETYHIKMVVRAAKELREKGVEAYSVGGGFLEREGDELSVYGQSGQIGKFSEGKVVEALQKAYPHLKIVAKD